MTTIFVRFNSHSNDTVKVLDTYKQIREKIKSAQNGFIEVVMGENNMTKLLNLSTIIYIDGVIPEIEPVGEDLQQNFEPQTTVDVSEKAPEHTLETASINSAEENPVSAAASMSAPFVNPVNKVDVPSSHD